MKLEPERKAGLNFGQLFPECDFASKVSQQIPTDISLDSRCVIDGSVFVALRGETLDREQFIASAFASGAAVALKESASFEVEVSVEGVVIGVPELRQYLPVLLKRFFGEASNSITLVGITGTNGKTSCADYLLQLWAMQGKIAASLGTLGWRLGSGEYHATGLTTLDVVENHRMMSRFAASGVTHVVMEVSSHGIAQGRIAGLNFDATALSNITRDHLDYHGSFEAYTATKLGFLARAAACKAVNIDDEQGDEYCIAHKELNTLVSFSLRNSQARIHCKDIRCDVAGTKVTFVFESQEYSVQLPLIGMFNVSNVLLVSAVLFGLGEKPQEFVHSLAEIQAAPGRLQKIDNIFVDYAHTPDALENALLALKPYCKNQLYLVFGCGGDRDVGKRALMAKVAERHADVSIVTSDNPRTEDQNKIIEDVVGGFENKDVIRIEPDRAKAIALAIQEAQKDDIVLVAGKGHEDYQEINGHRYPFSDIDEVKRWVA